MSVPDLTDELWQEFSERYKGRIPNPEQYPRQYEFLVKSFLHGREEKERKKHVEA